MEKTDQYRPLKLALKRMAIEMRAERQGLQAETCLKLANALTQTVVMLAGDLDIPPETLAQALLKKWQEKGHPREYATQG